MSVYDHLDRLGGPSVYEGSSDSDETFWRFNLEGNRKQVGGFRSEEDAKAAAEKAEGSKIVALQYRDPESGVAVWCCANGEWIATSSGPGY